jgi:hypothetical protein
MDEAQSPLDALSLVPRVVNSVEGLFGRHSGAEKKESAMAFVLAALRNTSDAAGSRAAGSMADEQRFQEGLSKMIDGAVECLKASSWARRAQ